MAARVAVTAPLSDDLAIIPNRDGSVNVDIVTTTTSFAIFAPINIANAGSNVIVAPVPGKTIRIVSCYFVVGGAINVNWTSSSTGSDADGVQDFAANGGIVLPFNPIGWFDTVQGEGLNLVTSNGSQVGGGLKYVAF